MARIGISNQDKPLTALGSRTPDIDWRQQFSRHWNDGSPETTHAFNALSLLFPDAERYFIEVVREVAAVIGVESNPPLAKSVSGFIAQESNHCQQHACYNAVLRRQGYENVSAASVARLQEQSRRRFSSLTRLAIVCAYEHYTAILGNYILCNPQVVRSADPGMALLWGWHGAEETEHKAVCFELYRAAGGGWFRRVAMFLAVTTNFALLFGRVYLSLLARDGSFRPSRCMQTIRRMLAFFFSRSGVGWRLVGQGLSYLSPRFHPWNQDNRAKLQRWLSANDSHLCVASNDRQQGRCSRRPNLTYPLEFAG